MGRVSERKVISQEILKEFFNYDPLTGKFARKIVGKGRPRNENLEGKTGKEAYFQHRIDGKLYLEHVLVWIWCNGPIPEGVTIDHIDQNKSNNKLANLRLASSRLNNLNRELAITSKTKVRGVFPHGDRFRSQICINYKTIHLGIFETVEEASAAFEKARNAQVKKLEAEYA